MSDFQTPELLLKTLLLLNEPVYCNIPLKLTQGQFGGSLLTRSRESKGAMISTGESMWDNSICYSTLFTGTKYFNISFFICILPQPFAINEVSVCSLYICAHCLTPRGAGCQRVKCPLQSHKADHCQREFLEPTVSDSKSSVPSICPVGWVNIYFLNHVCPNQSNSFLPSLTVIRKGRVFFIQSGEDIVWLAHSA